MNLSYIIVDNKNDFLENDIFTWQEIYFALLNGIVNLSDVNEYVKKIIDNKISNFDLLVELMYLNDGIQANVLIRQLIDSETVEDNEYIKSKWLYLILRYVYIHKNEYTDFFQIIDNVYADFDYPCEISNMISYMPYAGIDRMRALEQYLDDNKKIYNH